VGLKYRLVRKAVGANLARYKGSVTLTILRMLSRLVLRVRVPSRPLQAWRRLDSTIAAGATSSESESAAVPAPQTSSTIPPVKLGPFLSKYGSNLTKLAADGRLDPVIGRAEEIARAIQVLSRRTKNNPLLIGEPGVGKTAIAEGLARRIFLGDVPESMKNKTIISLDLASMLAGAKFRGEFEERLKGVLKDIEMAGDRIILFIDEMHVLVGAGGAEGAIDASNILKPPLARGLLRCMGATTTEEFKKYIEKDAALARRFQSIVVPEPTVEDTVTMLQGLRTKYESHHGVRITDAALEAAAKLSHRYMTARRLPDKAIDLIDEASSRLRMALESTPQEILVIEQQLAKLQIQGSSESTEVQNLLKTKSSLSEIWEGLRGTLAKISDTRVLIDLLNAELQRTLRLGNYARAKEIEHVELVDKARSLESLIQSLTPSSAQNHLHQIKFQFTLCENDIAEVVAKNTGIPVGKLLDVEKTSLLRMEQDLANTVIGQPSACSAIARCIRLSRAGLRAHDRPLGVFLMLGPTGVGKTELAKALALSLFRDREAMLRLDMSEYMEKHSMSRLVGAPPGQCARSLLLALRRDIFTNPFLIPLFLSPRAGYVGHENGGILTDAVRRKPYSVLLLDEFEKAHREVSNLLLQVFDEGRLSDSHGKVADFRNTVIILTANLGSDVLYADKSLEGTEGLDQSRAKLALKIVNSYFSPEFVNRLDEVICFSPLDGASTRKIADIQLDKVKVILLEKKIALKVSDAAAQWLAETGYSSEYGARPLKRLIQNVVLNPLAFLVLEDKLVAGATIVVQNKDESVQNGLRPLEIHAQAQAQALDQSQDSALRFYFE